MLAYWVLYLGAAALALSLSQNRLRAGLPWVLFALLLVLLVGLRHEVGCDWLAYKWYYTRASREDFAALWELPDPGYQLINWVAAKLGWGVYGTNVLCTVIFATGLFRFCRSQPNPWIAVAVAIPYLVVVVAMGYTRQAVALGLTFWALTALENRDLRKYLLLMAVATLFHKTAVLLIPLGLFLFGKGWLARAVAVVCVGLGLWAAFLAEYQEGLWENYVDAAMQSQGATFRIVMNLMPAILLLALWKRWSRLYPQSRIWFWMALAALVCVPLLPYASTAVDRIALYLTPLQVVVYSRLPGLATRPNGASALGAGVLLGYAAVLYVWLNHATHAHCWVPYDNLILQ
jgi:hypothetical protein